MDNEMQQMPPPYNKGGYNRLPQGDPYHGSPQPTGGFQPYPAGPSGYAPAPQVFQQQSSNTNVVVVGQPSTIPQTTIVQPRPRANEYLALTLVLMVLCFLHGNVIAFLFLIPALICSCVASDHNNAGNFESAKQCGNMALGCNICAIIKYVIALLVAVALVVVYFTIGFSWLIAAKDTATDYVNNHVSTNDNCISSCQSLYGYDYRCTEYCA